MLNKSITSYKIERQQHTVIDKSLFSLKQLLFSKNGLHIKFSFVTSFGELEETTRTPSYYVNEDYPAGPEIQ